MGYNALVIVSFGGPENPEQVLDFLQNVARGKNIPPKRLEEVADRYLERGGYSPANDNNRKLMADLKKVFHEANQDLKIYLGNRNSPPFILDALNEMHADARTRALAFITSPYASYSSCRQYLENVETAQTEFSQTTDAPAPNLERLRHFYNHPTFIEIHTDFLGEALASLKSTDSPKILFTAHSLPLGMAENCDYEKQLIETCELVVESLAKNFPHSQEIANWQLVYQSVSGPPQNWLGPNILDALQKLDSADAVVVSPIGFLSDHMEVIFDLDTDAKKCAEDLGLEWARAKTPQSHPKFVELILELVEERTNDGTRRSLGSIAPDFCLPNCCIQK